MESDKSRFTLEYEDEVIIRHTGRHWLELPIGEHRQLTAKQLEEMLTKEEFLKVSSLTST